MKLITLAGLAAKGGAAKVHPDRSASAVIRQVVRSRASVEQVAIDLCTTRRGVDIPVRDRVPSGASAQGIAAAAAVQAVREATAVDAVVAGAAGDIPTPGAERDPVAPLTGANGQIPRDSGEDIVAVAQIQLDAA